MDETRLAEAIVEALQRATIMKEESAAKAAEAKRRQESIAELLKLNKNLKDTSSTSKAFERILLNQKEQYRDVQKELEELQKQLDAAASYEEKRVIRQRQLDLESANNANNLSAAFSNASLGVVKFTTTMAETVASAGGQLIRNLQGGQSGIRLSSDLMQAGVEATNQAAQTAGAGLAGLGTLAMTLGGRFKYVGAALIGLGGAVGFFGSSISKVAKFAIEVLSTELERTTMAYQRSTDAGAIFANGLGELRQAATDAGLRIDQFSEVINRNADTLATSGLGVAEAIKQVGRVGKVLKEQRIDERLLLLGYGFQEQAELTAEVIADMRRASSRMLGDPQQVAAAVEEYAKNLRVIAAITGEDAKRKMDEARRLTAQTAFRIRLQQMEERQPGIMREMQAALATMTPEMQTAVSQLATMGAVSDQTAATLMATNENFRRSVEGTVRQLNSGNFSAAENQALLGKESDQFRERLKNAGETNVEFSLGIAGLAGKLTDVNKGLTNYITLTDKLSEKAVRDARTAVEALPETEDALSRDVLVTAGKAAQEFAVTLQDQILPILKDFASLSAMILDKLKSEFQDLAREAEQVTKDRAEKEQKDREGTDQAAKEPENWWDKTKRVASAMVEAGGRGAVVGGTLGAIKGAPAGPMGIATGATVGAVGGALLDGLVTGITEWFNDKEGKSRGGIAVGPSSGFLEKLHGSEAVVPLPDGRSIPVSIDARDVGIGTEKLITEPLTDIYQTVSDSGLMLDRIIKSGSTNLKEAFDSMRDVTLSSVDIKTLTNDFTENTNKLVLDNSNRVAGIGENFVNASEKIQSDNLEQTRTLVDKINSSTKTVDIRNIQELRDLTPDQFDTTEIKSVLQVASAEMMRNVLSLGRDVRDTNIENGFFTRQLLADSLRDMSSTIKQPRDILLPEQNVSVEYDDSNILGFLDMVKDTFKNIGINIESGISSVSGILSSSQNLLGSGFDKFESMADSLYMDRTNNLEINRTNFVTEIKEQLQKVEIPPIETTEPVESPEMVLARTALESVQAANQQLRDALAEQNNLMRESLGKFDQLVSLTDNSVGINKQILDNIY